MLKISLLHAPDHSILTSKLKNLPTLGGGTPSQTHPPLGRFAPSHLSIFHSVPPQCVDPRYATGLNHKSARIRMLGMGREPCSLAEYHAITIHPNIIHTSIYVMAIINERAIASERVLVLRTLLLWYCVLHTLLLWYCVTASAQVALRH